MATMVFLAPPDCSKAFPMTISRRSFASLAASAAAAASSNTFAQGQPPAPEGPVPGAVEARILNRSEPVLCAEKDNIDIRMSQPQVRSFRIQAVHPAYIGGLVADNYAADWTNCDFTADPSFKPPAPPRRVTLYETEWLWVIGYTYPTFWRPADVPVRIGNRVEEGLHLLQVWVRKNERAEEIAVVYPPDGYWRIRPLPPQHLKWSAYGSSFLAGPVEDKGRPIVEFKEIVFDPATMTFTTPFRRGGQATLNIGLQLDRDRLAVDVRMDRPIGDVPFASLRSMYVTEFNNDAARVAIRSRNAQRWIEQPIMDFKEASGVEFWAGRHSYSRHNTSAPDMVFDRFSTVG
jgi:hypothetical protein